MARILVVDDEATMRAAVRMTLERLSYTITEAAGGEAALRLLKTSSFDMVLLDMRMPGLDGMETLSRIREMDKQLPVVMVTGYGSKESAIDVMRLGANQYISKPFKNKELIETVQKFAKNPIIQDAQLASSPVPLPSMAMGSSSPTSSGAGPVFGLLMGLCLIAGGAFFAWRKHQTVVVQKPQNYTLPYSNPTSLFWRNDKLWVLDWLTQSIYVHVQKGDELPIIKTYHLPQLHITGMALVGDMLFTSDPWTKKIRKHKLDDFLTVIATYPSPGPAPSALFWDGKYLWCGDVGENKIYQLQLENKLVVIASYKAPGHAMTGFYKDANYAWTADTQTRRLYQHRLNDKLTVISSSSNEDFEKGPEPLSSFYWRNDELWFARDRKPILYRRTIHDLKTEPVEASVL